MNKSLKLMIGDRVYRRKGMVMHVGVVIGTNLVAHNSPDNNVEVISLESFAEGKKVKRKPSVKVEPAVLLNRLDAIKRENRKYCVLSFNCEHFANRLLNDSGGSEQLRASLAISTIGLTCKNKLVGVIGFALVGLLLCNGMRNYSKV